MSVSSGPKMHMTGDEPITVNNRDEQALVNSLCIAILGMYVCTVCMMFQRIVCLAIKVSDNCVKPHVKVV